MAECTVCVEKCNKSSRREVTCPQCPSIVCSACIKRYLLSTVNDPHCMACKKPWGRDLLLDMLTKSFLNNEYKEHRERVLFDREKALFPATIEQVEREVQINRLEQERKRIKMQLRALDDQIRGACRSAPKEKKQFVRACPADDCRGFLSTAWMCGLCEVKVCSKCHEIKGRRGQDVEHTCRPENVLTAELLDKETKPCPRCGSMIFRVSGCSQMFCTQCNTAFDWNTREIHTKNIHNPHYFEWLQKNGMPAREPGGCQRMPSLNNISRLGSGAINGALVELYRRIVHERDVEVPRYAYAFTPENNVDIRKKFLKKEIDEKKFESLLQRRELRSVRTRAIGQVYEMYVSASEDLFRNLAENKDLEGFLDQYRKLRDYAKAELDKVAAKYNCVVPQIKAPALIISQPKEKSKETREKSKERPNVIQVDSDSDSDDDGSSD